MSDFFGGLTYFLDEIIPEADDIDNFFDSAIGRIGGSIAETFAGGSGGSPSRAATSSNLSSLNDGIDTLALTENLKRATRKETDPLESVDPKQIQLQWFERLKDFSTEEI